MKGPLYAPGGPWSLSRKGVNPARLSFLFSIQSYELISSFDSCTCSFFFFFASSATETSDCRTLCRASHRDSYRTCIAFFNLLYFLVSVFIAFFLSSRLDRAFETPLRRADTQPPSAFPANVLRSVPRRQLDIWTFSTYCVSGLKTAVHSHS